MKKKRRQAAIDDMDTFVFDWKDICLSTLRIHQESGLPAPSMDESLYLEDILRDLEEAGVVDSLFAEKLEHIIRYREKFSFTEYMDHYELMEMLDFTRDFMAEYLLEDHSIAGK